MFDRTEEIGKLEELLRRYPAVGIIGARQTGKTTLSRMIAGKRKEPVHFFDLENPEDLARLTDPMLALKNLGGLVVLDEVQRMPEIFPVIRVLIDRAENTCRFLILGSASPELLKQTSETLAGRIYYHHLGGLWLKDTGIKELRRLWLRGGFPRSYLAESDSASFEWRRGFIRTFLERDVPQLNITIGSETLRRFWTMLAHSNGQIWNASAIARSFGVADTTVSRYLDTLSSALVVRQLKPWYENIKKRQVKAPKPFIIDTGLLHTLLNIHLYNDLESHPKMGSSWEGFIIEQLIRIHRAEPEECYFWSAHSGAELDFLFVRGSERRGYEIKRTSSPAVTASMRSALTDLKLSSLEIIHAGDHSFDLADKIRAVSCYKLPGL